MNLYLSRISPTAIFQVSPGQDRDQNKIKTRNSKQIQKRKKKNSDHDFQNVVKRNDIVDVLQYLPGKEGQEDKEKDLH